MKEWYGRRQSKNRPTYDKIKRQKNKTERQSKNRCEDCGGNLSGYTDDYFIRKCWCFELKEEEEYYDQI